MQELFSQEERTVLQELLLNFIRSRPKSMRFYGIAIGIAPQSLKLLLTKGTSDFKTLQKVKNYLESLNITQVSDDKKK